MVPDDSLKPVSIPASGERLKSTIVLGKTIDKKSIKHAPIAGLVFKKFKTCVPTSKAPLNPGFALPLLSFCCFFADILMFGCVLCNREIIFLPVYNFYLSAIIIPNA